MKELEDESRRALMQRLSHEERLDHNSINHHVENILAPLRAALREKHPKVAIIPVPGENRWIAVDAIEVAESEEGLLTALLSQD